MRFMWGGCMMPDSNCTHPGRSLPLGRALANGLPLPPIASLVPLCYQHARPMDQPRPSGRLLTSDRTLPKRNTVTRGHLRRPMRSATP